MKKLILATLLVVGMSTFAQVENKKKEGKEPMEKMSPAERVEKGLKRMTKQQHAVDYNEDDNDNDKDDDNDDGDDNGDGDDDDDKAT